MHSTFKATFQATSQATSQEKLHTWIILPTYNESENLPKLYGQLSALNMGLHILVVDDASPDGTGDIADQIAEKDRNFHVLHRAGKNGLGTAYLAGFKYALDLGADAVFTMDCDFSHDPKYVPGFIEALKDAEVVVGSRYVPGGSTVNWGFHRKFLSASANMFVRALFGMRVADCTSGFRLYHRKAVKKVLSGGLSSSGYAFQVEALHKVVKTRAGITEVPICFHDRVEGQSKMGTNEIINGMISLLRVRRDDLLMNSRILKPLMHFSALRPGSFFRTDP
jgi:dolichol-phosphate mannosyltransferase